VAGQLGASLVIDHFGLVGYAVRPIGISRLAGALLVAAGVYLVQRAGS
jgi:bacterial/archaeal transporter family-2 protein